MTGLGTPDGAGKAGTARAPPRPPLSSPLSPPPPTSAARRCRSPLAKQAEATRRPADRRRVSVSDASAPCRRECAPPCGGRPRAGTPQDEKEQPLVCRAPEAHAPCGAALALGEGVVHVARRQLLEGREIGDRGGSEPAQQLDRSLAIEPAFEGRVVKLARPRNRGPPRPSLRNAGRSARRRRTGSRVPEPVRYDARPLT